MKFKCLGILFICVALSGASPVAADSESESSAESREKIDESLSHIFKFLIADLQKKVEEITVPELSELQMIGDICKADNIRLRERNELQQKTIEELKQKNKLDSLECDKSKKELEHNSKIHIDQDDEITKLSDESKKEALKLEQFLKEHNITSTSMEHEQKLPTSCLSFGDSAGIFKIQAPGGDSFDVLCDNQTAGPGWLVIQQRINGEEDFNRDWATYRTGFGSFDGDFFLGLQKIHRLTNSQTHELYIHMESSYDSNVQYAQYDRFAIAAETDRYRLNSLGAFSGNVTRDAMRAHQNLQFSTFDRDSDSIPFLSCAEYMKSGWWFDNCATCNLNGLYYRELKLNTVFWDGMFAVKSVKMLIRPKVDTKT